MGTRGMTGEDGGPTLLPRTFGQVATILAAVGAADPLLIKLTARPSGTQPKTRWRLALPSYSMGCDGSGRRAGGQNRVMPHWLASIKTQACDSNDNN